MGIGMKEDFARKAGRGHKSNGVEVSGLTPFPEPENQRPAVLRLSGRSRVPWGLAPYRAQGAGEGALSAALAPLPTSRQQLAEDRVWRGPGGSAGRVRPTSSTCPRPVPPRTLFDWTGCCTDWLTLLFSGMRSGEGWTSSAISGAFGDPTDPEGWRAPSVSLPQRVSAFVGPGKEGGAQSVCPEAQLFSAARHCARTRRAAGGVKGGAGGCGGWWSSGQALLPAPPPHARPRPQGSRAAAARPT